MKAILAAIVIWSALTQAQVPATGELKFDQQIASCENAWFGAKNSEGTVVLGYVYVDPSKGFTYEHYGYLDSPAGTLQAIKSELHDKARLIVRIENNFLVTCLTEAQAAKLGLPSAPESMKFYKDERPLGEHYTSWAYHSNHIGASDVALGYVLQALAAGASSPSLTFEHAFALNALGRFDETIAVLSPASNLKTADLIAELAYAYLMKGEYQKSIEIYTQAVDVGPSERRWEFARNIAVAYEKLGDAKQQAKWIKRSDRYKREKEASGESTPSRF